MFFPAAVTCEVQLTVGDAVAVGELDRFVHGLFPPQRLTRDSFSPCLGELAREFRAAGRNDAQLRRLTLLRSAAPRVRPRICARLRRVSHGLWFSLGNLPDLHPALGELRGQRVSTVLTDIGGLCISACEDCGVFVARLFRLGDEPMGPCLALSAEPNGKRLCRIFPSIRRDRIADDCREAPFDVAHDGGVFFVDDGHGDLYRLVTCLIRVGWLRKNFSRSLTITRRRGFTPSPIRWTGSAPLSIAGAMTRS